MLEVGVRVPVNALHFCIRYIVEFHIESQVRGIRDEISRTALLSWILIPRLLTLSENMAWHASDVTLLIGQPNPSLKRPDLHLPKHGFQNPEDDCAATREVCLLDICYHVVSITICND